jgi:hypothetical protein
LRTKATLTLACTDGHVRRSLEAVLRPDNEGGPRGLEISMGGAGQRLEFRAEADSLSAAVSTVLALLRDVALFQEVWLLSQGMDGRIRRA